MIMLPEAETIKFQDLDHHKLPFPSKATIM